MKVKNLLFAIVLAMMLLCAGIGSTANPAPPSCLSECLNTYNLCKSSCGSDPECFTQCWDNYICCRATCRGEHCTN